MSPCNFNTNPPEPTQRSRKAEEPRTRAASAGPADYTTPPAAQHAPANGTPVAAAPADDAATTPGQAPAVDARAAVERALGAERIERYFADARFDFDGMARGGAALRVVLPSAFQQDWLRKRFGRELKNVAKHLRAQLEWAVDPGLDASGEDSRDAGRASAPTADASRAPSGGDRHDAASAHAGRRSPQRRRYSLNEFIVGKSNTLAFTAVTQLIEAEGDSGLRALFLHGSCGLGKSHLLSAAAERFRELNPGARVRYTTGEQFTNEYVAAVRGQNLDEFRRRIRALDLLCIDDVHFVAGKSGTQTELLHTFDKLDMEGGRVILASDEHPKRIDRFSQRLVSRCVSGLVARIERPERELREQIARRCAARRGLALDDGAVRAVASLCRSSVRDIEGAVLRLEAFARLMGSGGAVSQSLVRTALAGAGCAGPGRPVRVATILDVVCRELNVDASDVLGSGRHRLVVLARSITAYLSRELTTLSFPEIASAMNRPNHSTIVTANQRIDALVRDRAEADAGPVLGRLRTDELIDRLKDEVAHAGEMA